MKTIATFLISVGAGWILMALSLPRVAIIATAGALLAASIILNRRKATS